MKQWQHDETGRVTEAVERPGARWHEIPFCYCTPEPMGAVERLRNGGQPDLADQVATEIRIAHAEGQKSMREQLESIGAVADCPACGGRGERIMGFCNGPDAYQDLVDCPDCKGTGYARVRAE